MTLLNADGKSNLHTHSIYCDGKDAPEQMVRRAIELGFTELGFSGHEYAPYDLDVCMTKGNTLSYREEVRRLQEKYAGQIRILLGIERDYYGDGDPYPYDYVIGSVHYLRCGDAYLCVEDTEERFVREVEQYYRGDFRACVEDYYETVGKVVRKTGADIIGHFDIVTKFNEGNRFFDEGSAWYRAAALDALHRAAEGRPDPEAGRPAGTCSEVLRRAGGKPVLEINTGAMAKGYRTRPYPDRFLIEEAERLGLPMILSSDCHDAAFLDYGFAESMLFIGV